MKGNPLRSKIIILGCPGSGKSTFARKLHCRTNIPLIHLDNLWWNADRTHITREEFDRKLMAILQGDQWIIDGDYSRTYELRFRFCDTVIFLDFDENTCMNGIRERVGTPRDDIPWTARELDSELVESVRNYHITNRPRIYRLLEQYPQTQRIIFKTRLQAEQWLSAYSNEQSHNTQTR